MLTYSSRCSNQRNEFFKLWDEKILIDIPKCDYLKQCKKRNKCNFIEKLEFERNKNFDINFNRVWVKLISIIRIYDFAALSLEINMYFMFTSVFFTSTDLETKRALTAIELIVYIHSHSPNYPAIHCYTRGSW